MKLWILITNYSQLSPYATHIIITCIYLINCLAWNCIGVILFDLGIEPGCYSAITNIPNTILEDMCIWGEREREREWSRPENIILPIMTFWFPSTPKPGMNNIEPDWRLLCLDLFSSESIFLIPKTTEGKSSDMQREREKDWVHHYILGIYQEVIP